VTPAEPGIDREADPRRTEALELAKRALARREHTQRSLLEKLCRAGVSAEHAEAVAEELTRAGLLDEGRFAHERARVLAERGKGDAAIRFELERERAARLIDRRGATPATARLLASRGFDEDVVAAIVAREP
jgi:SOS response regulatory protein OraA/RecX